MCLANKSNPEMVDDDDPESVMWWERGGHTCEGYSSILCVVCVKEHEEALTEKASKRSRGRQCKGCGDDISDRPLNHSVCLDCYHSRRSSGGDASKRSPGRRCEGCGDDISNRPLNHSVCLDCYRVS